MRKGFSAKHSFTAFCMLAAIFFAGLPTAALAQLVCQNQGATVTQTGTLEVADADQTTRVFRGGSYFASTYTANAQPSGAPIAGTYNHDAYTFTNTTGQNAFITVQLTTACMGTNFVFVVAYSSYIPATPNVNIIGNIGASPGGAAGSPAYFSFAVAAGASYTIVVSEVTANAGCPSYTLNITTKTGCRQPGFDRNHDGSSDFAVFHPTPLVGFRNRAGVSGAIESREWGIPGDIPITGDYTGDGQTDLAVYRPGSSTAFIATTQTPPQTPSVVPWGTTGDVPLAGDFDGDGKTDVNIWRPSSGFWYSLRSSNNTLQAFQWGASGDTPVAGDYDGDSLADYAVARPIGANYQWFVRLSNFNYSTALANATAGSSAVLSSSIQWGLTTDKLVPGDYNGDSRTDIAVWRPSDGTFYIRQSNTTTVLPTLLAVQWGQNGDIPQPADYNGDRLHDTAVYRPTGNNFFVLQSGSNTLLTTTIGAAGDLPASSPYFIQ